MIKVNKKGFSRTVILIGRYALKFPSFQSHKSFLYGCYCNWIERMFYKNWNIYGIDLRHKYAPSIYCFAFGLLQIQKRCVELNRNLTTDEIDYFKDVTSDIKKENFGYYNNKLVCLDYA